MSRVTPRPRRRQRRPTGPSTVQPTRPPTHRRSSSRQTVRSELLVVGAVEVPSGRRVLRGVRKQRRPVGERSHLARLHPAWAKRCALPSASVGVAQLEKRMRGMSVRARCRSKSWLIDSACSASPWVLVKIGSATSTRCPSRRWCRRHSSSSCSVVGSRSMQRRLLRVLTGTSRIRPATTCRLRAMEIRWVSRCQSPQRSPASSPRRIPLNAARCNAG